MRIILEGFKDTSHNYYYYFFVLLFFFAHNLCTPEVISKVQIDITSLKFDYTGLSRVASRVDDAIIPGLLFAKNAHVDNQASEVLGFLVYF